MCVEPGVLPWGATVFPWVWCVHLRPHGGVLCFSSTFSRLCPLLGLPQLAPGCAAWVDLDLLLAWSEVLLSPLGVLGDSWVGLTIIKLSPPTPASLKEQVLTPLHKNRHFSHKDL